MSNDNINIEILEETIIADVVEDTIQVSIEGAAGGGHIQNTDTKLDEGGPNEVSASQLKSHINNAPIHREINYDEDYKAYLVNNS